MRSNKIFLFKDGGNNYIFKCYWKRSSTEGKFDGIGKKWESHEAMFLSRSEEMGSNA